MDEGMRGFNVLLKPSTREALQAAADEKKWALGLLVREILEDWVRKRDKGRSGG